MTKIIWTPKDREREIKRLRKLLGEGKFTVTEMASLRGKIGGLSGAGNPGRKAGGLASAFKRWGYKPADIQFPEKKNA
jgi:hypothetical protein